MQQAPSTMLIPRTKLFGNPSRALCQISPDGRWLSWVAPKDGVLNIWVEPIGDIGAARVITDDKKRGIRMYAWVPDSAHLLYMQDEGGTEEWHVYAVEIESRAVRDLTPFPGVNAQIDKVSLDEPGIVAVAINNRDKAWHDYYRVDVRSGERLLIIENDQQFSNIVLDRQLRPRVVTKTREAEGGSAVFRLEGKELVPIRTVEHEDDLTTSIIGFTRDGKSLYGLSSIGRDKSALVVTDWATGKESVLAEHPKADIWGLMTHPETFVAEAAAAEYLTLDWIPLNERVAADLKVLHGELRGDIQVTDRSHDDKLWIVLANAPEAPGTYHLYRRDKGTVSELFSTRPELKPYRLQPMHARTIPARDGLELTPT